MFKKWLRTFVGFFFRSKPGLHSAYMDLTTFKIELEKNIHGLLFSSESDYPFETIDWGQQSDVQIQQSIRSAHPSGQSIQEISLDALFSKQIQNRLRSGDEQEAATAKQFQRLQDFLASQGSPVRVWRCGRIEIGVYIVCRLADGHRIGLKTTAIET